MLKIIFNMDSNTSVAIVFIAVAITMGAIVTAILNYSLKKKIIKSNQLNEFTVQSLQESDKSSQQSILKWAIVIFMAALGLVLLSYLDYSVNSTLPYGIEGLFIAAGLFLYYKVSSFTNSGQ